EPNFPAWKPFTLDWIARASRGINVTGGPMHTRTMYFYNGAFAPFGRSWGAGFAPTTTCTPAPSPSPPCVYDPTNPLSTPCPSTEPSPSASVPPPSPSPLPTPTPHKKP
ncbi:MAG TPA: hypothetical protein VEY67_09065, partial [Candidatus Dormibacteraeota bacterium]|nr:hypothetical protein [Candidatus Dormibacteraeota bacterium]